MDAAAFAQVAASSLAYIYFAFTGFQYLAFAGVQYPAFAYFFFSILRPPAHGNGRLITCRREPGGVCACAIR
jgi:hypothetical protein